MTDPLKDLLQRWRHEPSAAPNFNAGVWARIDQAGTQPAVATVIPFRLLLPLAASLTLIASVAAGVSAGLSVTRSQTAERMATSYARTIDPILKASTDHVHPQP
ncbi:MAG TPA: hypothetical protein VGD88_03855 [Opitutaceae bacterium]